MTRIIGIDLGTSYSCAAVVVEGEVKMIPNALGDYLTPSVVRLLSDGGVVVGAHALGHQLLDPASTITGIKRLIGRRYNEVFDIVSALPYEVCLDHNNLAGVRIREEVYTPQFISALILKSIKEDAERYLHQSVCEAVITVPAYFNDIQRQTTKEAATIAGLEVKRLINEPTSACLAYGLDNREDELVAVFDLGGGTFDISIMEVGENLIQTRSTGGDGFLGGDDFDSRIADWLVEEFDAANGIDVSFSPEAMQRVRAAAVAAKHEISLRTQTRIQIPFLGSKQGIPCDLDLELTRTTFLDMCEELFDRLRQPCLSAMRDAQVSPESLNQVLLVGGATRTCGMDQMVESIFGKIPSHRVNPDEAVALGAGIQAAVLDGRIKDLLLLDVTSASLGLEDADGAMIRMIRSNTTIPTKKTETFTTLIDDQTSVEIHILQGEHNMAESNRSLGRLVLQGLPAAPKHTPAIEVTFDIDANGILNITARDNATGKDAKMTVLPFTGLHSPRVRELADSTPPIRPF